MIKDVNERYNSALATRVGMDSALKYKQFPPRLSPRRDSNKSMGPSLHKAALLAGTLDGRKASLGIISDCMQPRALSVLDQKKGSVPTLPN